EGAIVPGSKGWYADTLGQLLANVAYIGMTYTRSRRRREGDLIPAQWPALVDRPTWDAVQRQLQSKRGRRGLRLNSEPGREYAFRGLIVCGNCGRRMAVHNDRNRTYYRCRGIGAPDRCQGAWARETRLLEWGDELFGRLDALRRSDFAQHLAAARDVRPQGPGALDQVEATIERNRKLFSWGHITEEAYRTEHARLDAVREELAATVAPSSPPVELEGLLDAWRTGLPIVRRELLGRLFDGLEVSEGQVVRYIPRKDREAAVTKLVDLAWPIEPQVMGFGGPGGI
ncbi:MAG TPA: recombinase zinc beta ribbon domain-containing protein, partial [Candidatus Dormibacteraeota bacterium]